ncbi:MAG TPA: VWA domain-containing protein [Vicinamibacterales bacterium]|nr:VWA domain-containing protein [Vicinamibacterales bacterium]
MLVSIALAIVGVVVRAQQPAPAQQPPVFRGGTTLVQVDAIVTDDSGTPVVDLAAADFDVLDDGRAVPIERVRFLGAAAYEGDSTLAPIRTHEDEEREASRDDVRVYAIVLDDYHVQRMGELRVVDPLIAFVQQLPPTDLVAVYYPLDSMTDVAFSRNREPVLKAIRAFKGRRGDYQPTRPVEEEHVRHPRDIERIRREITMSALEGLATHLGGIKQGRKTVVFVSEGFTEPTDELRDVYQAASRANVAIYPVDPQGMTTGPRRATTTAQMMNFAVGDRDMLAALASETGGRPIVERNDIRGELQRIVRDATAYYLIAYESPHPDDGKFHRVTVRVKRPKTTVFARTGYWSVKRGQNTEALASLAPDVAAGVQDAVKRLADSLRPNAEEPTESPRRILMPQPVSAPKPPPLLAEPTVAVMRGRVAGDPVPRREFRRTDTILIRAVTAGEPKVSARLLNHIGQPLTSLPVAPTPQGAEITLPLGSLGAADYVVELTARGKEQMAQQFVAFRLAAR